MSVEDTDLNFEIFLSALALVILLLIFELVIEPCNKRMERRGPNVARRLDFETTNVWKGKGHGFRIILFVSAHMRPLQISQAVSLALCKERILVIEEKQTGDFGKVDEFIKTEYKTRFFSRVLEKLDSHLQLHAQWAKNLNKEVKKTHIRLDNLKLFLIQLNYFLGQQKDLEGNRIDFCHGLPGAPNDTISEFYIFLDELRKEEWILLYGTWCFLMTVGWLFLCFEIKIWMHLQLMVLSWRKQIYYTSHFM
jgi:hypothetical protein